MKLEGDPFADDEKYDPKLQPMYQNVALPVAP